MLAENVDSGLRLTRRTFGSARGEQGGRHTGAARHDAEASARGHPSLEIIDQAIQMHGGAGVSDDVPLAELFATIRTLRIADGPDEVHRA